MGDEALSGVQGQSPSGDYGAKSPEAENILHIFIQKRGQRLTFCEVSVVHVFCDCCVHPSLSQ